MANYAASLITTTPGLQCATISPPAASTPPTIMAGSVWQASNTVSGAIVYLSSPTSNFNSPSGGQGFPLFSS